MMRQDFALAPFPAPVLPDITIQGTLLRQNNLLSIYYTTNGDIEDILLPLPSVPPTRKDELWKATCFEFFLAVKGSPQYWEFNLSPSGDWNAYHMDTYRRIGFKEEQLIRRLPFEVHRETGNVRLSAELDLSPLVQTKQVLNTGIAAIIQTTSGHETYWALAHPAPKADFHLRESFILVMEE